MGRGPGRTGRAAALLLLLLAAVALAAVAPAAAAPGDGKPDLPAVVKFLAGFMKKRSLGRRDPEDAAKRIDPVPEEDLSWIHDRLLEVPEKERGEAAAAVLGIVRDRLLTLRYGAGVLRLPGAWERFQDPADAAREALLADLGRLEDPEPGTRFALWALEGGSLAVRLRALDLVADLCSCGGDEGRLLPALRRGLADPSPAVRDLALERLANLCDADALDWCLAHMGEAGEETAEVRGVKERRCPGDRAIEIVTTVSKLHWGQFDGEAFRGMSAEDRAALQEEYRAWRAGAGRNPLRDLAEGPFDPIAKVTVVTVDPVKAPRATARWWSEVDRAQFRLDIEDAAVVATSKLDWIASYHLTVGASGARQGDWEADARRVRCGSRFRLPRKGFGLVEVTLQPLLDGRWRIFVRAYEWRPS